MSQSQQQRSKEDIDALIKVNEAEEQKILGRTLMQESMNAQEEMRRNAEIAILEIEINKLQGEYDDAVKEITKISDTELAREEQSLDQELSGLYVSGQSANAEYDAAMKKYEAELQEYNKQAAEIQRKSDLRDQILKEAGDFMALGLIPTDYSGDDDAIVDLMYKIKKEAGDPGVPFGTTERVVLRKYNEFVKAYQQFSIKYRKDIEKYSLEYDIDGVDIRKVGEFYMPFGLRHVLDVMDPARMGGIVRPYWRLKKIRDKEGVEFSGKKFYTPGGGYGWPAIVYSYNGSEWVQDSPTWTQASTWSRANKIGSDKEKVWFDILGRSGLSWNQFYGERYYYAPFLREFDELYRTDFSENGSIPDGIWQLPLNYRIIGLDPNTRNSIRNDQRLAFERCPRGYWFRRGIPEEASQCVYMGDSMVDYQESFYPAYLSPRVFAGKDSRTEYDIWEYNPNSQVVERKDRTGFRSAQAEKIWNAQRNANRTTDNVIVFSDGEAMLSSNSAQWDLRKGVERAPQPSAGTPERLAEINAMVLFNWDLLTKEQRDAGDNDPQRAAGMGYTERDIREAKDSGTLLAPRNIIILFRREDLTSAHQTMAKNDILRAHKMGYSRAKIKKAIDLGAVLGVR